MVYSDFTLERFLADFNLQIYNDVLFPGLTPIAVPQGLTERLAEGRALALLSEKARSEFIAAPVLLAVRQLTEDRIAIYSGQRLDVDPAHGLAGECDFLLAETQPLPVLRAPIVSVIEAPKADIDLGLGQCAAQMLGSLRFNEQAGVNIHATYGCVTNGREWQFLRLEGNTLIFDTVLFYVADVGLILAAFLAAIAAVHASSASAGMPNATTPR
jgi:hypothetical protein